jgi:hypothetical protein
MSNLTVGGLLRPENVTYTSVCVQHSVHDKLSTIWRHWHARHGHGRVGFLRNFWLTGRHTSSAHIHHKQHLQPTLSQRPASPGPLAPLGGERS